MKDDMFKQFFLQLANDIVLSGTWPEVFKNSTTVIIPKPSKDNYSNVMMLGHNTSHSLSRCIVSFLFSFSLDYITNPQMV